ncbi:MAG: amylosucrase [Cyclonatronaceae bacterium]
MSEAYFQQKSRQRLYRESLGQTDAGNTDFRRRFEQHFEALIAPLHRLYHDQLDFAAHFSALVDVLNEAARQRPETLQKSDADRLQNPQWFRSHKMVGAVCYVDLFNHDLKGVTAKIPYFKELGITYLHLMPLFKAPENENDGGYAVSSYREVQPHLGSMEELKTLIAALRKNGISPVLDFINNHTSEEHFWAERAKKGDEQYQEYYYMFDDRRLPDAFEPHLREIFPEVRRGNFTWHAPPGKWIWTSFHNFQWDLNYRNPGVFVAMVREMLFLANLGVDVLRLDAVPFTWKIAGTVCENLPQAHDLIRALNACARIAAPGLLFKSEAIVHPDDVIEYVAPDKCQLSYNPTVMALLWESLATRKTNLLRASLRHRFQIPDGTAWINYVRSHDDIGWTFADDDAAALGINGFDHRHFLNRFYCGDFPGSFSKGVKFQYNPDNQDMRVCGTTASLAGLERGLSENDAAYTADAINRIALMYGLTMSIGGVPLLYLGDEIGLLNDYEYVNTPGKSGDARWVHRPRMDWKLAQKASAGEGPQGHLFARLKRLIKLRKEVPPFSENALVQFGAHHPAVLAFEKRNREQGVLVLANFSEARIQHLELDYPHTGKPHYDLISGEKFTALTPARLRLESYQLLWLVAENS